MTKKASEAVIVSEPIEVSVSVIGTGTEPEVEETETPKQRLDRLARATVLAELFTERVKALRAGVDADLLEQFDTEGITTKNIVLGDLGKVGTLTVPLSNDSMRVTDTDAYTTWVEEHYPSEVEYKTAVRGTFQKVHLEGLVGDPDEGEAVDTSTGEIVPGVSFTPGGKPATPRLSIAKAKKAAIAEELMGLPITELMGLADSPKQVAQ